MISGSFNRGAHITLVATIASFYISVTHAASPQSRAVTDLGALAIDTPITATIWLRPHDERAFEAAIAARTTSGSAEYHRWMTPEQVASYSASNAQIDALEAALRQQGLTIVERESDNSAIRIAGPAATVQSAFHTSLHEVEQNGVRFYRAVSTPAFVGAHADMIAGISGLTNVHLTPYVLHQIDFATANRR